MYHIYTVHIQIYTYIDTCILYTHINIHKYIKIYNPHEIYTYPFYKHPEIHTRNLKRSEDNMIEFCDPNLLPEFLIQFD